DAGTFRDLDLAVEVPPSALSTVCSHEQWEEIYNRIATLVREHRTTLVFVNTRKMAERIAAQLTKLLGADEVTSHHGSLSRERRLEAEQRLKAGKLRALVATASLELGIDIGDVDLVVQVGATRSIATLLQRVGRSGHALARVPRGRIFPLTVDELVEAAALLRCVRAGLLDRTPAPPRPLDILAQQVVASCVAEAWDEQALVGTVNEDWAIESTGGDIFQLGNTSWQILRVEPGIVRVADAKGAPPSLPFWLGEGPGRTRELSAEIAALREECGAAGEGAVGFLQAACGQALPEAGARQIADYVVAGQLVLGAIPTQKR